MRKYATELVLVKSYKKGLVFLMAKTPEIRHQKSFPEASKGVFIIAYPISYLKPMPHFIPVLSSILESSRLARNLPPP